MALNFDAFMEKARANQASFQNKSWYPDYVQAYSQGKDALLNWAQTAGQNYPDFDGNVDGNFVGSQVAGLQAINSNSSWDKVGDVGSTLGKVGLGASLLYAGGVGAGLAGEGAGAGAAAGVEGAAGAGAAGDAAVAGGAGTDALAGGATAAGGSTGAAGAAPMGDYWTELGLTAGDVGETAPSADYWSQYGLTADDVGAGGTAPAATTGSAFTSADLAKYGPLAARLAPSLLGAYASNKQTGALQGIADRFSEYGAPSRARYEASMTPGFDPTSIPGYQGAVDTASKSVLAKLSATGGNPFGNPGGLIDANKQIIAGTALPAIQTYQNQNANTGFGGTLNAAGSFGGQAIGSNANIYNAVGAGINDVVNPPKSLAQQLAEYEKARKSIGGANSLQ